MLKMMTALFFLAGAVTTAHALPATCPPLGALPAYSPDEPKVRDYAAADFKRKKPGSDDYETVVALGRFCSIVYGIDSGHDPMSDLEIQSNYRDQLGKLGAEVTYADELNTFARLAKEGATTWLSVYSQGNSITLTVVRESPPTFTLTSPGPGDYRLLGHMPAYVGDKPVQRNFDEVSFKTGTVDQTTDVKVQGKTFKVAYGLKPKAQSAADPEIQWNYREALRRLGAEILFTDEQYTTARLVDKGQTVWTSLYSQNTTYELVTVEEKPFEPSIKAAAPGQLKRDLDNKGRVSLYVNFDFGRATLRPEAEPILAQVLALLKDDPGLKLTIEGHTDNVGGEEANLKLSRDRAAAVVAALTAKGTAANRLTSAGFGLSKPIAPNESSDGRAKNRRVELVKG